ncbi:hypothetical protein MTR_2g022300 [Medicago truncatula]|uniref:DUF7913 domain-containing protein n=1 Tax=Medicago truncatula TaxID=3880 RepID=A0A072V601_MEDTR|nr:hypothetical protein MTR_2g022300 [Medicago truncatula]
MDVSELCPTVELIRAFLEYLVDPLLQEDHSTNDDLPLSQHEKVAKQNFLAGGGRGGGAGFGMVPFFSHLDCAQTLFLASLSTQIFFGRLGNLERVAVVVDPS